MPKTKRQKIVDAAGARLKTVTGNVFHRKENAYEQGKLPCIGYEDTNDSAEDLSAQLYLRTLTIEISVFAKGTSAVEDVRQLMAQIEKTIGTDLNWSGLAEDTIQQDVGEDISMVHKDKKIAGGKLVFEIQYTTDRFNPYE